ncbi:endonuclease MutS2 [Desulfuromonas thiophila]|uniref:Endonuclease MutS2 n=1 Tax=Desulfuromonas thiophila TaxID=57664 RepID=A0A1G6WY47_9BACT|nr:endonuclease MutS2 [Desulfuromonas thiophila]SDD70818.1 DNA mismatch repair protein MutS2 [Desulfuromonas thiophila]
MVVPSLNSGADRPPERLRDSSLRALEFDKLIDLLATFTVTPPGRCFVERLRPLRPRIEVEPALQRVMEARALLEAQGAPPLGGSADLAAILDQSRAVGSFLPPAALLLVADSAEAAQACRRYFGNVGQSPLLAELASGLEPLPDLSRAIRRSIGSGGEVRDEASWQLADLRQQSKNLRQSLRTALESLLQRGDLAGAFQDQIVTERNGRYVVPVRADHRGQVKGFIHDESASGQTLFIEPEQVLERNNQLQSLLRAEQREIERILLALAEQVRQQRAALAANQALLAQLDGCAALARFARLTDAVAPQLTDKRQLELEQARHPLLLLQLDGTPRSQPAVAVDLRLGRDSDTLIISGPNTGGKSVALKTLGLLFLMVSAGIPVPCAPHSRVYLFRRVFADIGDAQSIESDLSTFSGHLVRLRRILRAADSQSLVLLDEAGTGTDPAEGGALALAVLDHLRGCGARTVVTTHLNLIKGYAYLHPRVQNAAVEFDPDTLAPTYRLHYGVPGSSSALTIARRLGLPARVLQRAEEYLGSQERDSLAVVERLNALYSELTGQREETARLLGQARLERDKRRQLLEAFERQRGSLLERARRQAEQTVSETRQKMRELLRQARELGAAGGREQAALMQQLHQQAAELRPLASPARQAPAPQELKAGELVRVVALDAEAEVLRCSGTQAELSVQGKRLRLPLTALEAFRPRRFAASGAPVRARRPEGRDDFSPQINLIGCRVEEALPQVERLIDDALLHNWRQVSVVHGHGSGALRQAIQQLLAGHRAVTAFHAADTAQGGTGVTLIELGDA